MVTPTDSKHDESPLALLADPDADARVLYADSLRRSCRILEAQDGTEAMAKVFSARPDILITETRLPGIGGLQLCRLVRMDAATRDMPIVVVTADASNTEVSQATTAGADLVLVKPCLPSTLRKDVNRLLKESAALRSVWKDVHASTTRELATSRALLQRSRDFIESVAGKAALESAPALPSTAIPLQYCPVCHRPLTHVQTSVGGLLIQQEHWDYFECGRGCGTFQYRHKTGKLRRMP